MVTDDVPDRRSGDTYTVPSTGNEGDHAVRVMACDQCGHLLPIAVLWPDRHCIDPDCGGRYEP